MGTISARVPDELEVELDAYLDEVISVGATPLYSRLRENRNLSDADAAVLACADDHNGIAVMDGTYGRDVAAAEGITTRGTAFLVLKCTKQGAISSDDARTIIDAMIDEGWYCAPDVYTKILRKLETLSD